MQHTDCTQPRIARNDFAHPDEWECDATPAERIALAGAMLLAGVLIGWAIEAVFIAINAPLI